MSARKRRARTIYDGRKETSWVERFSDAIGRFCDDLPPLELVETYFGDADDLRLQDWVYESTEPSAQWAQAIEIIEACEKLADNPRAWKSPDGIIWGPHHDRETQYTQHTDAPATGGEG
jgi:hypothetical protein